MHDAHLTLELPYEPPLDWEFLLGFLRQRLTAGVESISADTYTRTAAVAGDAGLVFVRNVPKKACLEIMIGGPLQAQAPEVVARVRRMFDLELDHAAVANVLASDPVIGPLRRAHPGIRIPGAWTPFEVLLRTIVGQQVSVPAATTIAGRVVARLGDPLPEVYAPNFGAQLDRLFPEPQAVAEGDLAVIGMPERRVAALQTVARHVADGLIPGVDWGRQALGPSAASALDDVKVYLMGLPGIGPWTAEFFALRALGDRDAWPITDLVLRRELERQIRRSQDYRAVAAEADPATLNNLMHELSKRWRPYRAYAALHLWHAAARAALP